jgi:muramoyltetrapeptide carboxypeptidase
VDRRWGYLAGADEERAADLQSAIDDEEVRGILFARGGWGTSRIMDRIDVSPLKRRPKVIVGYSDLTVLFAEVWRRCRLACGYGPVVGELGRGVAYHRPSLHRALFRPAEEMVLELPRRSVLVRGRATGRLIGGCLTLLAHLRGTPRWPDTRGAVVFLEEVGEEPYRVDRLLWQLRMASVFDQAAAVLVGQMTGCDPRPGMRSFTVREVLADHLSHLKVPVLTGLPAGHGKRKWTLPLGFTARVDAGKGRVTFTP